MALALRQKSATKLENRFSEMTKLELECAELSASEAKITAFLQQTQGKVREFRVQDVLNRRDADAELARLSDDLQRSLHAQHEFEARMRNGEEELSEIAFTTAALVAERDKLDEQKNAHVDECSRLQRRSAEEREEIASCQTGLQEVELEIKNMICDIEALNDAALKLADEKKALLPRVTYQRHLDHTELCVVRRCQHLNVRATFKDWASVSSRSHNLRPALAQIHQKRVHALSAQMLLQWREAARCYRAIRYTGLMVIQGLLQIAFGQWYHNARRERQQRRALCAQYVYYWHSISLNLRRGRVQCEARRFLQNVMFAWCHVARKVHKSRRLLQCLVSFCQRRLLRKVTQWWVVVTRFIKQRRHSTLVFHRHRQAMSLRFALKRFRKHCEGQRNIACAAAKIHDRVQESLRSRALQLMKQTLPQIRRSVPAHCIHITQDSRSILKEAFRAFHLLLKLKSNESIQTARRRRLLECVYQSLLAWRAAVHYKHAEVEMAIQIREQSCRRGIRHWHDYVHKQRAIAVRDSALYRVESLPLAFLRRRAHLRWWSRFTSKQHMLALRQKTVERRRRLGFCVWAFSLWRKFIWRARYDECENWADKLMATSEELTEIQTQQDMILELRAKKETERHDLLCEIHKKRKIVCDLRAQLEETKAGNVLLLGCMDGERRLAEEWARDLQSLNEKHALAGCDGESERVEELEMQIAKTLEVQGALRFALLRCAAEANRAFQRKGAIEAHSRELQRSIEEFKHDYNKTVENLDVKTTSLVRDGREVQQNVLRLEKALAGVSFRMRMCELELERWETKGAEPAIPSQRALLE